MMMGLMLVAAVIAGRIISSATSDSSIKTAKLQTEKIASQILSGKLDFVQRGAATASDRKFASVQGEKIRPLDLLGPSGVISMDPWGNPLAYRIWTGTSGKTIAVVWSTGPDQRSDTSESELSRQEKRAAFQDIHFGGDDIGTILAED